MCVIECENYDCSACPYADTEKCEIFLDYEKSLPEQLDIFVYQAFNELYYKK